MKESKSEAFLVQVHPKVAAILIGGGGKPLKELEEETGRHFHFHGTEHSPLDTFQITAEGTREEIEHRALPFSKGEEVLIRIEEPHMYNEDDAIAKIDGYVISIAGGGPHVGQKKLIRIEEVKRTAAYAVRRERQRLRRRQVRSRWRSSAPRGYRPDGAEGDAESGTSDGEGEQVQSTGSTGRRRRGRRGGRRRSRARPATARPEQATPDPDMAYAIIEMGGKQYRVEKGDSVVVDRVPEKEGAKVSPRALLYRSDETVSTAPSWPRSRSRRWWPST